MPRRLSALLLTILALSFLPGCSLLGLAIGSQIPHYQAVQHATRGDALYVQMDDGDVVHGAAVVVDASAVTLLTDERERVLATKHIKTMARRRGTEWLSTFLIGLAVDVTVGAFAILGLSLRH
ncbi:MAG TPA: hypothetical protein VLM85_11120 [Polyangiaceae bacterium]|nr:hypothetical protein [Polyangiaceae bacterium]